MTDYEPKRPHPKFTWPWALWSLHMLSAVWLYPALFPAALLGPMRVSWWLGLSVFPAFGAVEYAAKRWNHADFRETLSEIATWVWTKLTLGKSPLGWGLLLMGPYIGHIGWLIGVTLYPVLRLGDVAVLPAAVFATAVASSISVGLWRHWTDPVRNG